MNKTLFALVLLGALVFSPLTTSAATLSAQQISAILGLLQAFGADQSVINNVHSSLTGTTGISTGTSSDAGTSQGTSSNPDFAKLKITNTNPGASSTFVTATIKGTPDNKKVYVWNLEMLCPAGVIIYGKNGENICGQTLKLYTYNMYDPTQDYLALTIGIANNSSQSATVVLALSAYDNLNNRLDGDKAQIILAASGSVAQPYITVVSPNGGENLVQGQQSNISWKGNSLSGVFADLVPADSPGNGVGTLGVIGYVSSLYNNMWWDGKTVWSDLNNGTPITVPPGNYKIHLVGNVANTQGQTVSDMSDNYFNLSDSPTVAQPIKIISVQYSPAAPKTSDWITTAVTITNTSSQNYNTPFQVDVSGTSKTVNSLAAGAQTVVTFPSAFTFTTPGTYTLHTSVIYPIPGLPGQGTVGDIFTNTLTFSSTDNQPSITITSPNGGENYTVGQVLPINWTTHGISKGNKVTISLLDKNNGFKRPIASLYTEDINTLTWGIPSDLVPAGTVGAFKIDIQCSTTNIPYIKCYDTSDNPFNVSGGSSTANKPPVITGLTAPSSLVVGETGKWVVNAYDPEGSPLTYLVNWGEPQIGIAKSSSVGQEASFTHSYATAGTYKISITVVDNAGQAALTSATVQVGAISKPAPTLTVISPNGGETLTAGQAYGISWKSSNIPADAQIVIQLTTYGSHPDLPVAIGKSVNDGYELVQMPMIVGDNLAIGVFYNLNGTQVAADGSDTGFSVVAPATTPTVTVTSPFSHEVWRRGNIKTIQWTTTGVAADALMSIRAVDTAGNATDIIRKTYNTGRADWSVGSTSDYGQLPAGFYRIRVCIAGPSGGCAMSSKDMLEIKEKSDGTSAGTSGAAVGASSPTLWDWLGRIISGQ